MFRKFVKSVSVILSAAILMVSACSCVRRSEFRDDCLKVVCTVYPVYSFAKEIAGDKADIKLLVKPGSDAHTWELTTDDMFLIEDADVLIASGANMEPWLDTCLEAIENKNLTVCDASTNIDLITMGETLDDLFEEYEEATGESHDNHDEDHEGHDSHGHDHSANSIDPHTWLSLDNALVASSDIADCLSKADPENEAYYRENCERFRAEIEDLKTEFDAQMSTLQGSTIVVSHGAFGYFCKQYGMMQMPIEGVSNESEPDARTMSLIIDFVRENDIDAIFYDSIINPSAAAVISEETGCRMIKLRSLGSISKEDFEAGLGYVDAMHENISALCGAL